MTLYNKCNFNVVVSCSTTVNYDIRATYLAAHHCPSDTGPIIAENYSDIYKVHRTNYLVNMGQTDTSQNAITRSGVTVPSAAAPFGVYAKEQLDKINKPFAAITDGLSNTMMLSEAVVPHDAGFAGMYAVPIYGRGAGFTAYYSPNSVGPDVSSGNCYTDLGGAPGSCDYATSEMTQILVARSRHPGGVNVAMCDGSVRFVSNTLDLAIWRAMATAAAPAGGEPLTTP
jgi:prepilin-type processing-associated H-X9-DG protein